MTLDLLLQYLHGAKPYLLSDITPLIVAATREHEEMRNLLATTEAKLASMKEVISEIVSSGVSFDDARLDYVELQVSRSLISEGQRLIS